MSYVIDQPHAEEPVVMAIRTNYAMEVAIRAFSPLELDLQFKECCTQTPRL